MNVRGISSGLHQRMQADATFSLMLMNVIVPNLFKLGKLNPDFDDYCVFIKIEPEQQFTKITYHDGGAKYDEKLDALVHVTYGEVTCFLPSSEEMTLYYGVNEQVLTTLDER